MENHMAPPLNMNATCGPVHRTEMAGVEAASSATPLVLFQDALRELDLGDQAPGRRHARVITECTPRPGRPVSLTSNVKTRQSRLFELQQHKVQLDVTQIC